MMAFINSTETSARTDSDAVEAERKAIDLTIEQLTSTLLSLRLRRNTLAPINRLPPEIMTEIFVSVAVSKGSGTWILPELTQVCHHWRDIAISYPHLWSTINFTSRGWIECLNRAKSAPLTLLEVSNEFWSTIVSSDFSAHLHRVRDCQVTVLPEDFDVFLDQLMVTPTPMLERMSLMNEMIGNYPIFKNHIPSLRRLILHNVALPWRTSSLAHLTDLSIRLGYDIIDPSDFFHMLKSMTMLQSLELFDKAIPECPEDHEYHTFPLPHLSLLHLRRAGSPECIHLLKHLTIPSSTTINFDLAISMTTRQLRNFVESLLSQSKSNNCVVFIDLTYLIDITIKSAEEDRSFRHHVSLYNPCSTDDIHDILSQSFGEFSQITCLSISFCSHHVDRKKWRRSLEDMNSITSLVIHSKKRSSCLSELLVALGEPTKMLLPKLRTLDLIGLCTEHLPACSENQPISHLLLPMLQVRWSCGAGMKRVKVACSPASLRGDVSEIKGFVDQVEFEEGTCQQCQYWSWIDGEGSDSDTSPDAASRFDWEVAN